MKLLAVTALKEYREKVTTIFRRAGIHVFSATDIIGFNDGSDHNLINSWFGISDARFDYVFLFSFTEDEKANTALQFIREYNLENPGDFPLRAFILPVENSSQ
ncbi:MAG: hypothetical protein ABIN89_15960 [Chitinophagaceae bacterium]